MLRVLIVFGTRPEAIKMAPLIHRFKLYPKVFETKVCVTAQHRELLDQVLKAFSIVPDRDLNVMSDDQTIYDITNRVLREMGAILKEDNPDLVLVHGDTTTTFATSLAAHYQRIPVGHVEAGLRTSDPYSPFPEEMNRRLTTQLAKYHFAPTERNKRALLSENVVNENILVTGNTVIDALKFIRKRISCEDKYSAKLEEVILKSGYRTSHRPYCLITAHRRENFGKGMVNIALAINRLASKYPDYDWVYPVHPNPNVHKPMFEMLGQIPNVYLIQPLSYEPFVYLMERSLLMLTDSGGIQEEAPSLGVPILVLRENTERPEAVESGTVRLVGTDSDVIVLETSRLLDDRAAYEAMSKASNPYGDGLAAQRIVDYLLEKTKNI
jgi:UDP-N-acetylglucosamine 2-epimerase (non-hydrolysing)